MKLEDINNLSVKIYLPDDYQILVRIGFDGAVEVDAKRYNSVWTPIHIIGGHWELGISDDNGTQDLPGKTAYPFFLIGKEKSHANQTKD